MKKILATMTAFLSLAPLLANAGPTGAPQQGETMKEKIAQARLAHRKAVWQATGPIGKGQGFRRKGELLVTYRTHQSVPSMVPLARHRPYQARRVRSNVELVSFDESKTALEGVRKDLGSNQDVLSVEPNFQVKGTAWEGREPGQMDFKASQRHMARLLKASSRKAPRKGGAHRKIRVGVMDTGLDFLHPDLVGQSKGGFNPLYKVSKSSMEGEEAQDPSEMDYNGHGTMAAGIIGAGNNDFGIDGIDDNVELYGIKVLDQYGIGTLDAVLDGIYWAIENRMDVLNMSFGNYERSAALEEAIRQAAAAGILIFASAGNDFADDVMYPAALPEVIAVGSHAGGGLISRFSNWGGKVEVYADGEQVLSTSSRRAGGEEYTQFTGTSASAAQVSGIASLLLDNGKNARQVRRILAKGVPGVNDANPTDRAINILDEEHIVAMLEDKDIAIPRLLELIAEPDAGKGGIRFEYSIANSGDKGTVPQNVYLDIQAGDYRERFEAERLGVVSPGRVSTASFFLPYLRLPAGIRDQAAFMLDYSLHLESDFPDPTRTLTVTVYNAPKAVANVLALWVDPQRFDEASASRTAYLKIRNPGSSPLKGYSILPGFWNGTHEAVWMGQKNLIGKETPIPEIPPNGIGLVKIPLPGLDQPPESFTLDMEIRGPDGKSTSYMQSHSFTQDGLFEAQYSQAVHVEIAKRAVQLLRKKGIYIPELHNPGSAYFDGNTRYAWGDVPNSTVTSTGYWTDAQLAQYFPGRSFSLVDGAWDADGIDPIYGYFGLDTWDTHFWVVDNHDDDGLNNIEMNGSSPAGWTIGPMNHESAYTRINATLNGGAVKFPKGVMDHYRLGHKKAAWWFLGQAVHLIGDISLGSHVNDENTHGWTGDVYHNWMDKGKNASLNGYVDALDNFINPYQPAAQGQPVRFLAYTTAQIGNSFPWYPLNPLSSQGKGGNRVAAGFNWHYDSYMGPLFAGMPARPLGKDHIGKNEVKNEITGSCTTVDVVAYPYKSADCNGDGMIDYDNTDGTTASLNASKLVVITGTPSDVDGDITKIGKVCYPYSIQAAAGLIYYFANETKQIRFLGNVPAIQSLNL